MCAFGCSASNLRNGTPMETVEQPPGECSNCQNLSIRPARVRSAFWHNDRLVVIEDVPALVCDSCGSQFYDDTTVVRMDLLRGEGFPPELAVGELSVPVFSFGAFALPGVLP